MQHHVAESLYQKYPGDQQHESEQHFVGARVELDPLRGQEGDESHREGGQQRKRNLRYHAMDGEDSIERVLDWLEKIF